MVYFCKKETNLYDKSDDFTIPIVNFEPRFNYQCNRSSHARKWQNAINQGVEFFRKPFWMK